MGASAWVRREEDHRRRELSRRQVLQGMLAASAAAATGTGLSAWATQAPARAAGAVLGPGTRPYPNRTEGVDTIPEIEHVVIYMQENHSFDQYYGVLGRGDGFTLGPGGVPTNSNPNPAAGGAPFAVYHSPSTCDSISGDHSWNAEHISVNGGAMDGFIAASNSTNVMGYFDGTDLPFYYGLASTFPICDRWFCSVRGPTHPNRRFLLAGTANGIVQTSIPEVLATPDAPNGTIFDRLDAHGISWVDYAIDVWDVLLYPTSDPAAFLARTEGNRKYFADFLHDCLYGTLPQVSIISPGTQDQYDEGSRDVQNGEAYSYSIITALMLSPVWEKTALLFTYDENGGGYDHVPPPPGIAPDGIPPRITVPPDQPGSFADLGPRVPGFVISPFAKKDYVSHVVHDHTSILKFLETKFNLPAITYRDANADDLLDCFDIQAAAFREPPTLPEPGLPLAGSACQPQPRPPTNFGSTTTTSTTSTTAPVAPTTLTLPVPGVDPASAGVAPSVTPAFTG